MKKLTHAQVSQKIVALMPRKTVIQDAIENGGLSITEFARDNEVTTSCARMMLSAVGIKLRTRKEKRREAESSDVTALTKRVEILEQAFAKLSTELGVKP